MTLIKRTRIIPQAETPNPMVCAGYLSQTGTDAPTLVTLLDTITGIVLARTSAGTYTATKTGAFPENKTIPGTTPEVYVDADGNIFEAVWIDANTIQFTSKNSSEALTDGLYTDRLIQITVFA